MKGSNKGFTLTELVVTMAVLAIVGGILVGFLTFSTSTYGRATQETDLQENAQIVLSQINNYVVDADATLKYYGVNGLGGSETTVELTNDIGDTTAYDGKRLEIYKKVSDGTTTETLTWKRADEEITYKKTKTDTTGAVTVEVEEQKLASDVLTYAMDLTKMSDKQVVVEFDMESGTSKYTAKKTIYLRNELLSNISITEGRTPVVSTVTGVRVIPQKVDMKAGSKKVFKAVVYGTNNPSQEVTWSFGDNKPESLMTTINARGELWIADNETAEELTIVATSVQDPTKSGEAEVTVLIPTKLTLGTIREYWTYPGYCIYVYARADGKLESDVTWEVLDKDGNPTNTGYTMNYLKTMHAACFQLGTEEECANKDYTIKISGVVDGKLYRDKAIVHVRQSKELTDHVNNSKVRFTGNNNLEYWIQPGESVDLSTDIVGETNFDKTYLKRIWTYETSKGISCDITNKWGEYDENITITVAPDSRTGEIWVNAKIDNGQYYYYDTITVHVYQPFDFPYVIETTKINEGENYYSNRAAFRGPVNVVDSTSKLTRLDAGIEAMIGGGYTTTNPTTWGVTNTISGKTHITSPTTIGADQKIVLSGIIVIDTDLNLNAKDIQSDGDTIIYVRGNHTLKLGWENCNFDGIIYAPEGHIKLECVSGFVRGVIISKEITVAKARGDGKFSIMDKQSVMDMVNSLKSE